MKKLLISAALLAGAAGAGADPAEFAHPDQYAGDFMRALRVLVDTRRSVTSAEITEFGFRMGYIRGVADFSYLIYHCTPKHVGLGEMQAHIEKYLRDNPKEMSTSIQYVVVAALQRAYPCTRHK